MATVSFVFDDSYDGADEKTDVALCANRWKVYSALSDVSDLLRELVNGKTYREKWMYPEYTTNENGVEEVVGYTLEKAYEDRDDSIEFVPVDYVVEVLRDALADVSFILE